MIHSHLKPEILIAMKKDVIDHLANLKTSYSIHPEHYVVDFFKRHPEYKAIEEDYISYAGLLYNEYVYSGD